jgi:hypothetical protein
MSVSSWAVFSNETFFFVATIRSMLTAPEWRRNANWVGRLKKHNQDPGSKTNLGHPLLVAVWRLHFRFLVDGGSESYHQLRVTAIFLSFRASLA